MKIKPIIASLIVVTSFFAAEASQAFCKTKYCPMQGEFAGVPMYSGTGWHMVPCNTPLRRAANWGQYVSGTYAPPATDRGFLFMRY